MTVLQPAHLKVCTCGKHAHIVTSSGEHLPEFFSLHMGLAYMVAAYEDHDIEFEEVEPLRLEIRAMKGLSHTMPVQLSAAMTLAYELMGVSFHDDDATSNYSFQMSKDKEGRACGYFYGPCGTAYEQLPIYSKNSAWKYLTGAIHQQYIPRDARSSIEAQIKACPLPDDAPDAE